MRQFKAHQEFVKQPATKAGDVVIFTEVRATSFAFAGLRRAMLIAVLIAVLTFVRSTVLFRPPRTGRCLGQQTTSGAPSSSATLLQILRLRVAAMHLTGTFAPGVPGRTRGTRDLTTNR